MLTPADPAAEQRRRSAERATRCPARFDRLILGPSCHAVLGVALPTPPGPRAGYLTGFGSSTVSEVRR